MGTYVLRISCAMADMTSFWEISGTNFQFRVRCTRPGCGHLNERPFSLKAVFDKNSRKCNNCKESLKVIRLPLQGVARYTRDNADRGEEVAILHMSCFGGEPAEFVSANCLEARLRSGEMVSFDLSREESFLAQEDHGHAPWITLLTAHF